MPDLKKPFIGKISVAHFLFFKPGGDAFAGIDHNMSIVKGVGGIVRPRIPSPHLVVGNACARRWFGGIAIEFANRKASGGSSVIPFLLVLALGVEQGTTTPGEAFATQQYRNGTREQGLLPGRTRLGFVENPELAPMAAPIWCRGDQQLTNIRRQFGWQLGVGQEPVVAAQNPQDAILFRHCQRRKPSLQHDT